MDPLCNSCLHLVNFSTREFTNNVIEAPAWRKTDTAFAQSVQRACPICRALWSELTLEQQQTACVYDEMRLNDSTNQESDRLRPGFRIRPVVVGAYYFLEFTFVNKNQDRLTFHSRYEKCRLSLTRLDIDPKTLTKDQLFPYIFKVPPVWKWEKENKEEHSNPENRYVLARSWLDICSRNHPECRLKMDTNDITQLPTRLIWVGTAETPQLYLCLSQDMTEHVEYVTLSHSWAATESYKLTATNIDTLKACIPFERLSKTFKDAVHVTRKLGFSYLWIYSLCILQDNQADWRYEASRMTQVYSFSACNIAASAANALQGLFLDQKRQIFPKFEIPPQSLSTKISSALSRARMSKEDRQRSKPIKPGVYACISLKLWWENVVNSPLQQRAWTFQERVLPKRTLHFTATGLFFECKELNAYEASPEGLLITASYDGDYDFRIYNKSDLGQDSIASILNWLYFIKAYAPRHLTKSSDKLIAISGIARQSKLTMSNTKYLAGLWSTRLEEQLLWSTLTDRPRPDSYRAPSWSWASVDSSVQFALLEESRWDPLSRPSDQRQHIKILNAHIDSPDGEFGLVEGGVLKIQCHLIPMQLTDLPHDSKYGLNSSSNEHLLPKFGVHPSLDIRGTCDLACFNPDTDKQTPDPTISLFCVPVQTETPLSSIPSQQQQQQLDACRKAWGLVLTVAAGNRRFRRVGCFSTRADEHKVLLSAPSPDETKSIDTSLFEAVEDLETVEQFGRYIITVV